MIMEIILCSDGLWIEKILSTTIMILFGFFIILIWVVFFNEKDESDKCISESIEIKEQIEDDVKISPDAISIIEGDNDFIPRPRIKELEEIEREQIKNETKN